MQKCFACVLYKTVLQCRKQEKRGGTMNRTEYKNQHRKEHYDTILFAFPKGEKERIKAAASGIGMSVNEYLFALICDDLASGESRFGKKKQGFQ